MDNFKAKFEKEAVKLMRDGKVPGMSILVTRNGEPIYERGFGASDWHDTKPATMDTIYGVASMTKSMTAMAILQLQEQGKLTIHDPISKYLPVQIGFEAHPITIHHLMCHASGIPSLYDYVFSLVNEGLIEGDMPNFPMATWDDFWFHVNDASDVIKSKPGSTYYYFNGGFTMLGKIIEAVSGLSYEDYMKKHLFEPLHMTRSTYSREELEKFGDVAKAHGFEKTEKSFRRPVKDHTSSPFNAAAGGLNSSVRDLTNYLSVYLNKGEFNGTHVLSEASLLEMQKLHNKNVKGKNSLISDSESAYGYGWRVFSDFHGYTLITHGGASGVSGGNVAFIPELSLTFAQLYNVFSFPSHLMYYALLLLIGKDPDKDLPFVTRRNHYDKLCGDYVAYKKFVEMKVTQRDGLLYLQGGMLENPIPLIPRHDDLEVMSFDVITSYGHMVVDFFEDDDGLIVFELERNLMRKTHYRAEGVTD